MSIFDEVIGAIFRVVKDAFEDGDPAAMRKVNDILDHDADLQLRAKLEMERRKSAREFGDGS